MPWFQVVGIAGGTVLLIVALSLLGLPRSISLRDRTRVVLIQSGPLYVWLAAAMTYPRWEARFSAMELGAIVFGGLVVALLACFILGRAMPAVRDAVRRARAAEALELDYRANIARRKGKGWVG